MMNIKNLPREVWRDIPKYEGLYKISNMGRVYSEYWHSIIKHEINRRRDSQRVYITVSLCKNKTRRRFSVARLVYLSFKGDIPNNMYVSYKDNNQSNVKLNNLKLIPKGQNKSIRFNVGDKISEHYHIINIERIKEPSRQIYYVQCDICNLIIRTTHSPTRYSHFICNCQKHPYVGEHFRGCTLIRKLDSKHWELQCDTCGDLIKVHTSGLRINKKDSKITTCSCFHKLTKEERYLNARLCDRYRNMMERCYNIKHKNYRNYGAVGIFVCKYWHNSNNFYNFIKNELTINNKLHLDRIDPRFEYAPYNCQLISATENAKKSHTDNSRSKAQLKIDELKFKRRKRNWIKQMKKKGYREEDLI